MLDFDREKVNKREAARRKKFDDWSKDLDRRAEQYAKTHKVNEQEFIDSRFNPNTDWR